VTAPTGSLAAEASALLDVLTQRLAQVRDRKPDGEERSEQPPAACPQCGHDPATPVTCTGCPLCAALALLRGERPEAAAKLAEGALAIVQVLRGLLSETDPSAAARTDPAPADDGDTGPAAAGSAHHGGLVRIDVR
jgi:hypothetical protein